MLSYDSPMAVNGQPTVNLTSTRQPIASSKPLWTSKPTDVTMTSNNTTSGHGMALPAHHHIWLVTGPAGCGKTTVAKYLAKELDMDYVEGDEFHSPENVAKMASGIALNDEDRWDWLTRLREEALGRLATHKGVVVTCSALKRKYRDVIRVAPYFSPGLQLHFIYLDAPAGVLERRVAQRQNHYMGPGMVQSQLAILEPPQPEEVDCITVDVSLSEPEVCRVALDRVCAKMTEDR